jgi:hypothetical protein
MLSRSAFVTAPKESEISENRGLSPISPAAH